MTPAGVHGRRPGRPSARRPADTTVSPSTSLSGSTRPVSSTPSRWSGTGSCTIMPLHSGSALRRSISSATCSWVASAGSRWSKEAMPASPLALCLPATYTAEAGSSPTMIVARPGGRPCSAADASASSLTCARRRAATARPSMIVADTAADPIGLLRGTAGRRSGAGRRTAGTARRSPRRRAVLMAAAVQPASSRAKSATAAPVSTSAPLWVASRLVPVTHVPTGKVNDHQVRLNGSSPRSVIVAAIASQAIGEARARGTP